MYYYVLLCIIMYILCIFVTFSDNFGDYCLSVFYSPYPKYGVLVIIASATDFLTRTPSLRSSSRHTDTHSFSSPLLLLLLLLTRLLSFLSYSYTHTHAFVSTTSLHRCDTFALSIGGRRGCYHGVNSRQKWWFRSRRVAKVCQLAPLCIGLRGPLFCTGTTLSPPL